MRRVLSILLFVLGGWMVSSELFAAFIDVEPGLADNLFLVALFGTIAAVPLLLGAWASPGWRWSELGLTILMAVGASLFGGISVLAILLDPGAKPFIPPMPRMPFALIIGGANLLLVSAVGWLLYRTKERTDSRLARIFGDG